MISAVLKGALVTLSAAVIMPIALFIIMLPTGAIVAAAGLALSVPAFVAVASVPSAAVSIWAAYELADLS